MRYLAVALSVAAASSMAVAQGQPTMSPGPGQWQYFQSGGMNGARVKGTGGSLVVKCDKPGKREVYAMLVSDDAKLAISQQAPPSRPIRYVVDDKTIKTGSWRFYDTYATALGKTADGGAELDHFIIELRKGSKIEMRANTGMSADVVFGFDVTGAREAVTHVYQMCKDEPPA